MLNRTDSYWYPTMRVFRQAKGGDWPSVIAAVRALLLAVTGRQPMRIDPTVLEAISRPVPGTEGWRRRYGW